MKKLLLLLSVICVSSSYSRSGLQQFASAVATQLDLHNKWQEKKALEDIQAEQEYVIFFKKFISKNVQTARNAAHATVQAVSNHIAKFAQLREKAVEENYKAEQERLSVIKEALF